MYLNGNLSAPFLPCTNPDSFSFFTPVFPCPGAFDHGWSRCKGSTAQRFLSRLSKPAVKTAGSRSETNEQRDKSPTKTFMETERECDQPRPWFNSNCRVLALLWIFWAIPGHLVKQLRAALAHGWKRNGGFGNETYSQTSDGWNFSFNLFWGKENCRDQKLWLKIEVWFNAATTVWILVHFRVLWCFFFCQF